MAPALPAVLTLDCQLILSSLPVRGFAANGLSPPASAQSCLQWVEVASVRACPLAALLLAAHLRCHYWLSPFSTVVIGFLSSLSVSLYLAPMTLLVVSVISCLRCPLCCGGHWCALGASPGDFDLCNVIRRLVAPLGPTRP